MAEFENNEGGCNSCVAFWPVLILSLGIIVSAAVGISGGVKQKSQLKAAIDQLNQVQPEIDQLTQKLEAVSNDLIGMAPTNQAAAQLVKEFNIRKQGQQAPAQQQAPAAPAK